MKITKVYLSSGPAGIAETLKLMRVQVIKGDVERIVKDTATSIIKGIPPEDLLKQIEAITGWVRKHLKYVKDVNGVEELIAPHILLDKIAKEGTAFGDCDDFTMLLSALLRAVGFKTRMEAVGVKSSAYNHARLAVWYNNSWVSIEGTRDWPLGQKWCSMIPVMYVDYE